MLLICMKWRKRSRRCADGEKFISDNPDDMCVCRLAFLGANRPLEIPLSVLSSIITVDSLSAYRPRSTCYRSGLRVFWIKWYFRWNLFSIADEISGIFQMQFLRYFRCNFWVFSYAIMRISDVNSLLFQM